MGRIVMGKEHFELHLGQVGLKCLWDQYSEMPARQFDMQACAQKEVWTGVRDTSILTEEGIEAMSAGVRTQGAYVERRNAKTSGASELNR